LSKIILVGVDGSQPAKKALEYAANLASQITTADIAVAVDSIYRRDRYRCKRYDSDNSRNQHY
jgi:nucleotide-binding universal stress UspA family protein